MASGVRTPWTQRGTAATNRKDGDAFHRVPLLPGHPAGNAFLAPPECGEGSSHGFKATMDFSFQSMVALNPWGLFSERPGAYDKILQKVSFARFFVAEYRFEYILPP